MASCDPFLFFDYSSVYGIRPPSPSCPSGAEMDAVGNKDRTYAAIMLTDRFGQRCPSNCPILASRRDTPAPEWHVAGAVPRLPSILFLQPVAAWRPPPPVQYQIAAQWGVKRSEALATKPADGARPTLLQPPTSSGPHTGVIVALSGVWLAQG